MAIKNQSKLTTVMFDREEDEDRDSSQLEVMSK